MRIILIMLLSFLAFLGCEKKVEKTNVGFVGTLSGRYSDLGQATLQGVMLALERTGADSYINLVVKDDFGKPEEADSILHELAEEGVKYVIGPNLSSIAAVMVPKLEQLDMYMVSPTVSTSALAGKKDRFIRTMPHNNLRQAESIAKYLIEKLGAGDVVVIYDIRNSSYSDDIVRKFTEAYMRAGGKVRDVRSFNPDSGTSLGELLGNDKENPPSLYYIIGSAMDTSLIIWQIKKNGFASKVLVRKWAASNEFYRLGGEAVEGVMLFDFHIDRGRKAYKLFADDYKLRFQKEPAWMSVYGYESARILVGAFPEILNGADFLSAAVKAAGENQLLPDMEFDEFGDAHLPLHFFEISSGETVYKGPVE